MEQKRSSRYTFKSMRDLKSFFSEIVPKSVIESIIKEAERDFRKREGASRHTNKLQFIKKCEWLINRKIKKP